MVENVTPRKTSDILAAAKAAKTSVSLLDTDTINRALLSMADSLIECSEAILKANTEDEERAKTSGSIASVMLDRLRLSESRIKGMADGIREVAALPSPLGRVLYEADRPNGLKIRKISIPFGVIAIIYESRPNVTSDAAALALKSGNVCVLRSGKEAFCSAKAIVDALKRGLARVGVTPDAVNLVEDTTRASATELMKANGYVDLLIPRGGAGLIRACVENATVPCVETGTGICHIYIDRSADLDMAVNILENAKTSRPSVCNAAEVCLVHSEIAPKVLPMIYERLVNKRAENGLAPVTLRADARAADVLGDLPSVEKAGENDFDTEFLDYILAVGTVDSVEEAVAHIAEHSTHHSEAIISADDAAIARFTASVDSAAVYVNASTRFTDGGEFGFGCEMGIATQKGHPRGPMGLSELTAYKYVINGNGQTR